MDASVARALLAALLLMIFSAAQAAGLETGDPAPVFELQDQNGEWHRTTDYLGQWLVLYFYPKDDTPGCTREACAFRDDIVDLKRLGAAVLGVSTDDVQSHQAFAARYQLPFPLLSDRKGEVARRYGALRKLLLLRLAKRHSFIIGPGGRVAKIYRSVDPETHSDQIIADLRALQQALP